MIGVLSGCGGAGASTFAAILAGCAASRAGHAFLLDCDPLGGGIDVLLGCEQLTGPRWSQVRLRGGSLDPAVLRESLPCWHGVSFLSTDSAAPPDPDAVHQVAAAGASVSPVLLDLPRSQPSQLAAAQLCDRIVLVTAAEVRAVTATATLAAGCEPARTSVVVRGSSRSLPPWQIAELLGLPVVGEVPYDPACLRPDGLQWERIRRRTRRAAETVLDLAAAQRAEPSAPAGTAA